MAKHSVNEERINEIYDDYRILDGHANAIPMRIPHMQLSPAALRAVIEEFVTRDGTDHSSVEPRIEAVLHELDAGRAELHFDDETQSCNILPV
jgi:uncharacterized protein